MYANDILAIAQHFGAINAVKAAHETNVTIEAARVILSDLVTSGRAVRTGGAQGEIRPA
jgi:hypothetical protein